MRSRPPTSRSRARRGGRQPRPPVRRRWHPPWCGQRRRTGAPGCCCPTAHGMCRCYVDQVPRRQAYEAPTRTSDNQHGALLAGHHQGLKQLLDELESVDDSVRDEPQAGGGGGPHRKLIARWRAGQWRTASSLAQMAPDQPQDLPQRGLPPCTFRRPGWQRRARSRGPVSAARPRLGQRRPRLLRRARRQAGARGRPDRRRWVRPAAPRDGLAGRRLPTREPCR
jgi:hypothetical protein